MRQGVSKFLEYIKNRRFRTEVTLSLRSPRRFYDEYAPSRYDSGRKESIEIEIFDCFFNDYGSLFVGIKPINTDLSPIPPTSIFIELKLARLLRTYFDEDLPVHAHYDFLRMKRRQFSDVGL